jgi:Mn-dependent DtxR family transcriptional regulator
LSPSQRELLSLIKKGKRFDTRAAREKGFKESSVYKFLKQLEEKRLIERQREYPMIELTEKGKQIADCLFEIKEIVDRYFPQRVEMEIINC